MAQQRTYRASAPTATHFREATCKEVDCSHYIAGWKTVLPLGHEHVEWIRYESRLHFTESQDAELITFTFAPGQPCFRRNTHRISLDRPQIFTVNNGGGFSRREPDQWVDDMGEQLHKLKG